MAESGGDSWTMKVIEGKNFDQKMEFWSWERDFGNQEEKPRHEQFLNCDGGDRRKVERWEMEREKRKSGEK